MNETFDAAENAFSQPEFEHIARLVTAEFQVEEALMEHGIPTFYLKEPQETKQAFLKMLENLEKINLIALLRRDSGRIVLRVIPKPKTKQSNILINWILFFATIGTTFATGYLLSSSTAQPIIGGVTFTIAIMAVLGLHEMGHKLTANRRGIEATPPYFIPGPPPIGAFLGIGTFGAVIVQKSLPKNKDSLFDIGASGPILGFIVSAIVVIVGLPFSVYGWASRNATFLPTPLFMELTMPFLLPSREQFPPSPGPEYVPAIFLHPVAFAGRVGLFVTMLNLMPAAMLDGGHVSRSLFHEKARAVLTLFSIISLAFVSLPMAFFVAIMSTFKHPGPLDDVSSLSSGRKILAVVLIVIFVLSSFLHYLVFAFLDLFGV